MSEDQGNTPPRYYIRHLDRTHGTLGAYGAPNWVIYERLPRGSNAVCLCYDESTAQRIAELLEREARLPAGLDDTGTI